MSEASIVSNADPAGITLLQNLAQRVLAFEKRQLLHDGRTNDLMQAIQQHASSGSEANQVIAQFNMLSTTDQQNILNFLRDL
jgi:CxxC motif-containing protein (DUF1111 family)